MSSTDTAYAGLETAPEEPPRLPTLGAREWVRWGWRQLTSMRTALLLLLLLAVLAVPGSVFPQRRVDRGAVAEFAERHPDAFPWLDRLSAFDVYSSPWFSAVYLLLFVSLVGCIVPRTRQHWRALRAAPPPVPRRLDRLPEHASCDVEDSPETVLARAAHTLRRRRYRVVTGPGWVAAERGRLRETGNLLFHAALLVILVAFALGNLRGFTGNVIVVEGGSFANTQASYDTFRAGSRFPETGLEPLTVALERFDVRYEEAGPQAGSPREFSAHVRWSRGPGQPEQATVVRPNHPLEVGATHVFVTGNGYAPHFTVRDATGAVVYEGATPFIPRDGNNTSTGVVKVPDAQPEPLGFDAMFLPTGVIHPERGPVSEFPALRRPRVVLTAFAGDLGSEGEPQSVFRLDTSRMTQLERDGEPLRASLAPGDTVRLPDGRGSITFDGVRRFANFQVSSDPGRLPALLGACLALGGLMAMLFVRRRRVWVRAVLSGPGRTVVDVGALSRTHDEGLADEVALVAAAARGVPMDTEERG